MTTKKLLSVVLALVACTTLWRCTDENQSPSPDTGTVTFTLDASGNIAGRAEAGATPTTLYVSITSLTGTPVLTLQKIKLLAVGGSFITEPLTLAPGNYRITDFLLTNDVDSVLYATPKQGSALQRAVKNALPMSFQLVKNAVSNIAMEVVDVSKVAIRDLGYVVFPIGVVNPLRISVFVPEGNGMSLTSATGVILLDGDTVKRFDLAAGVNTVSFPGSPALKYLLVVSKPGYNVDVAEFIYRDLDNIALEMYLGEILNIDVQMPGDNISFWVQLFSLGHDQIHLWINWGDGSPIEYSNSPSIPIHDYPVAGLYHITAWGELDHFDSFYHTLSPFKFQSINFNALPGLQILQTRWGFGPTQIDVRKCTKLEFLDLGESPLEYVRLPEAHAVHSVQLDQTEMSTAAVDEVIKTLYNAVVSTEERDGLFTINSVPWNEEGITGFVGPPSAASFAKLRVLRDQYGWDISPALPE